MEEDKQYLATQIRHLIGLAARIHKTSWNRFEKLLIELQAHKLMYILKCVLTYVCTFLKKNFLTTCRPWEVV